MTGYRLAQGGAIDRSRPLRFTFDGRAMTGYAGDTLASALLANGVMTVGRSFKYHRPRGVLTAGSAEPNALVTVGEGGRREPNTRATTVELHEGLVAESQNRWPSLTWDVGAMNGFLSPFIGAGFYYKTFMWPAAFWEKLYEPLIRRAAGLGRAAMERDPDRYEKRWAHCDLLVIGAGPAGLMAALTAARAGARVILCDEKSECGGSLLYECETVGGMTGAAWAKTVADELAAIPDIRVLTRTNVVGWYDSGVFGAVERVQKHLATPDPVQPVERLWRIVARRAVLASGVEERPLVFSGNDRPGVMMAGAVRAYLNRYAVAAGRCVAIVADGPSGYRTALDLSARGIEVAALIDRGQAGFEPQAYPFRVIAGAEIEGAAGKSAVRAIDIDAGGRRERIACDALAMSGGFSPVVHLACQRGAKPVWNPDLGAFLPPAAHDGLDVAGAAAGRYRLADCLHDGVEKAMAALNDLGLNAARPDLPEIEGDERPARPARRRTSATRGKAFIDFQNDVTAADLALARREGYGHVEHAKRYTTAGMATDQGKLSNVNTIMALADLRGVSPGEIGTTTFRPFYTPVSFGVLAGSHRGKHFQPVRRSPLHGWAEKNGAIFVEAGLWYRSAWFARAGETTWRESVDREAVNVRENAGLCDVSTLGKIEIFGADAAEFVNRVYCNGFARLPVGRARYGLMLREDGFVYDDGTTARLGEKHFLMTTTTAQAGGVLSHLEFCAQALWPDLDVRMISVSDQWAQMALAGPKSRDILSEIVSDDVSDEAVPFLAARIVTIRGVGRARLFRISFSGELAYELAVPSGFGETVADALMAAGKPHGLQPYGTEAMSVLRIEKGHVTHAEINGTVSADDLGMGRMASAAKPDFIGRAMLAREGLTRPDRLQLVGLKTSDPNAAIRSGAHILSANGRPSTENDQGYVTSACHSPTLGATIALALLKAGRQRHGETVTVWDGLDESETPAIVCDPVFVDPQNARLHG